MEITQQVWGLTPEGEAVVLYTMRNKSGAEVQLTNVGATIVGISVPDRHGKMADVALGYSHYMDYFGDSAAMGKTVGRVTNRTRNATVTIGGEEVVLTRNIAPHHSHGGGAGGFQNRLWTGRVEGDRVVFGYVSADGEEGYPGELYAEVVYDWDDDNTLEITMFARTSKPTIVNLTNHVYFNLAGESSGSVLGQELRIDASHFLATDDTQVPTGELVDVTGTPMDFRTAKPLGRDIDDPYPPLRQGFGWDHCWALDPKGGAQLYDPASGRVLDITTTQPGLQVYAGNFLSGGPQGKSGRAYADRDGVALECQGFPSAANTPSFPSVHLDPGQIYEQHIVFKFGVK
jgi:aldose 1-epimerase